MATDQGMPWDRLVNPALGQDSALRHRAGVLEGGIPHVVSTTPLLQSGFKTGNILGLAHGQTNWNAPYRQAPQ